VKSIVGRAAKYQFKVDRPAEKAAPPTKIISISKKGASSASSIEEMGINRQRSAANEGSEDRFRQRVA
jgi:hypothetical protein